MEFLLNHTGLFVFSLITLLSQSFFMLASLYLAKQFTTKEINKLDKSSTHIDLGLIIIFGMIISIIFSFIGTITINAVARYFYPNPDYLYRNFMELLITFSAVLLASYAIFEKPKEHLRLQDISPQESSDIHNSFFRTTLISIIITVIAYSAINTFLGTQYSLICEYTSIGIIVTYCFFEIVLARNNISKVLQIKKTTKENTPISSKIANLLNNRFQYVILFCMIFAIKMNCDDEPTDISAFSHINNIYLFLLGIIAFQCFIVFIINKFTSYIESVRNSNKSSKLIKKRTNNILWICNFIILSMYFIILCIAAQYSGINIKPYIFDERFFVTVFGTFLTIIVCKIFNEYKDTILEKAEKEDKNHYTKLKTFVPAISIIFHFLLFSTAILIILANLGINVIPIITSLSIFGATFTLAAQDIVKAFLQGISLLIEKNLYIGDFVTINDKSGTIEKLTIRVVYLRATNGNIHIIPYNSINVITNHSHGYTRHSELLRLVSPKDVEKAIKLLNETVAELRKDPQFGEKIYSDAMIQGAQSFDLTGTKIKWEILVHPTLIHISDEIYFRLIKKFEKNKIKLPPLANNISVNENS